MTATNALPAILDRHGVGRGALALDIGGPSYRGEESTRFLTDRLDQPVDVVAYKAEQAEAMAGDFGDRVRLLENEDAAEEGAYDLVVVSPVLGKLAEALSDAAWRGERLLKPGGLFITFGIDPAALGADGSKQPDAAVVDAYRAAFIGEDGRSTVLPPALDAVFELLEASPRKPGVRSYLNWLVLRRRPGLSAAAAGIDVTGGLARDVGGDGLDVVLTADFDTLLVTAGLPATDARVLRTGATLVALGRKVLCVRDGEILQVSRSPAGFTEVCFADPRSELNRRLRILGARPDPQRLEALHGSVRAGRLARLMGTLAHPGFVVHSEGGLALAAVAEGLARLGAENTGRARQVRWIHDIRRRAEALARADRLTLPDRLTCASDAIGGGVAKVIGGARPVTVWDTPRLADRFAHRGKTFRQKAEIEGEIVIHIGAVDARMTAVLEALPGLPTAHLVLLAPTPLRIGEALKARAAELGVSDRLHVAPAPAEDRLVGYIADADLGLALPEDGSDATARVFTHVLAGLPTLVIGEAQAAAVLEDWPVGEQAPPGDTEAMQAAIGRMLGGRGRYVAAMGRRPDLLLQLSSEVQATALAEIYADLWPPPRSVVNRDA